MSINEIDLRVREAAERARQQAAAAAFGVRALRTAGVGELIDDAVRVVHEVLRGDLVGMLEATPEPGTFRFRSGIGWRDGILEAVVPSPPGSAVSFMLAADRPVIYENLSREERFAVPPLLLEHGVVGGMGVIVRGRTGVLGVLGVHTRTPRRFTEEDADFLQTIANVLSEAIERARAETALRDREERFRQLAENAHDVLYRYRFFPEPGHEYINPAVTRLLGYTPEECYADPQLGYDVIHPEDRAALLEAGPGPPDVPRLLRARRKDGEFVWCELRTVGIHDDTGRLVAVEGIMRDATERKRTEDQLRQAYEREHEAVERLRALDEMKNAFLQAVSHELRTPLASVLGMAITLRQRIGALGRDDRDALLDRLVANAEELDGLLSDLLDLDRLMRRTIEPMRRPVLLLRLARDAVADAPTGDRVIHVDGDDVVTNVDAPKVERVLENLLLNAVRHTPPEAEIWVTVRSAPGGAELVVEDDGPGIPDDLKDEVFEPFFRGPSVRAHAPGAGVGLALVAKFAELHEGRAWVTDRPGGGASFHVLLPDAEPSPLTAAG